LTAVTVNVAIMLESIVIVNEQIPLPVQLLAEPVPPDHPAKAEP